MDNNQISILVRDFRAISSAEIQLDGITVVAGENGSGKSTLSKLLYFLFKTTNDFDSLVKKNLMNKLKAIISTLDMLYRDLYMVSKRNEKEGLNFKYRFREFISVTADEDLHEQEEKLLSAIDLLKEFAFQNSQDFHKDFRLRERIKRLESILSDVLKNATEKDNLRSLPVLFDTLKTEINKHFNIAYSELENRPVKLFLESLREEFPDSRLPKILEVSEFGTKIISNNLNMLSHSYIIQNVAYIDTPMSLGIEFSGNDHWDYLDSLLKATSKLNSNSSNHLNSIIQEDIIKGDITFEQNALPIGREEYFYKRSDGSVFNLLECATGLKSFAILQLLLKNEFLNSKTLLIIDEPEVHLHPQWIIEYARLIVLLNKEIGVKFFIASHNPDMVSALKYIAEKQGTLQNVNFYLSRQNDNDLNYSLLHLGTDIEKIFASFNISIDRINQYGAS